MATLFDHRVLAKLPASVLENPTLEDIRQYLQKETKTQNNLIVLWLTIGIGLFVYSFFHTGGIATAGLFMLGGGILVAFLSYLNKKSLQMTDEEIEEAIREHFESL